MPFQMMSAAFGAPHEMSAKSGRYQPPNWVPDSVVSPAPALPSAVPLLPHEPFCAGVPGVPIAAGLLYPFFGLLLSPMIAGAAMSFSSVSVIVNALRLRSIKL